MVVAGRVRIGHGTGACVAALLAGAILVGCSTVPATDVQSTQPDVAATESVSTAEADSGQTTPTSQAEAAKSETRSATASASGSESTIEANTTPEAKSASEPDTVAAAQDSMPSESSRAWTGKASYYGQQFAGELTASGEIFDPDELTAAHRFLPFGTKVRVTNLQNGQDITVRITDRGPFVEGRIIDVSRRAAEKLGMIEEGVVRVRVKVVD